MQASNSTFKAKTAKRIKAEQPEALQRKEIDKTRKANREQLRGIKYNLFSE